MLQQKSPLSASETTLRPGLMAGLFAYGARFEPEKGTGTGDPDPSPEPEPTKTDPDPSAAKPTEKEAELLKEVMDKKGKLNDAKAEKDRLEAELAKFQGIDPERARDLIAQAQKAEQDQLEKKGEWDKLKQQMVEAHENEKSELQKKIEELEGKLGDTHKTIDGLTIGRSFSDSKFINDELVLSPSKARVVYGDHFDIESGQVVAYDKPRGAEGRTQFVDGRGNPLGFDESIKKIVDADPDKDRIVRAKSKPGAGSTTTNDSPTNADGKRGTSRIAAGLSKLSQDQGPLNR